MKQKLNKLDVMRTYARKEFSFVPRKSVFELYDLTSREILSLRSSHSIELVNYRVSKYGKTLFDSLDDDKRWALQTQYERAPVTEEEYHSITTQLERYKDLFWLYLHRGAFDIAFEYEKLSGVNFESWCKLPRDVLNEKEELYKMWRFNESFHRAIEIAKWEYRGRVDKYGNDYNKANEYLEKIKEDLFEDIIDFHYNFEKIHPFQDGNGRVGRLIMLKECLKHNIVPVIINEELKLFYYRGLKEYKYEKGYLIDTCLTAQDKYKAYLDYFRIKY